MTAQPSSQAEREDVAREVLTRAFRYIDNDAGVMNGVPNEGGQEDADDLAGEIADALGIPFDEAWPEAAAAALCADREHATPRSMPEEVVEAYERATKVADAAYNEWSAKRDAAKTAKLRKEHRDFESMAIAASIIAAAMRAITGASA